MHIFILKIAAIGFFLLAAIGCDEPVRINPDYGTLTQGVVYLIGTGGVNAQGGGYAGSYLSLPRHNFALDDTEHAKQRGTYHFTTYQDFAYAKEPGMIKWSFDSKGRIIEQGRMGTPMTWYKTCFANEKEAYFHMGKMEIHKYSPYIMRYLQDSEGNALKLNFQKELDAYFEHFGTTEEINATKTLRDIICRDDKLFATFSLSTHPMYTIFNVTTRIHVAVIDLPTFSLEKIITKNDCAFAGDDYGHNQGMIIDEKGDLYILTLGNHGNLGNIDGINVALNAKIIRIPHQKTDFDDYELNLGQATGLASGDSNTACARGFIYAENGKAFTLVIDKAGSGIGDDISQGATNGPWYYGSVYRWCQVDLYAQTASVIEDLFPTAGHKACAGVYDQDGTVILATYTDKDFAKPARYNHISDDMIETALYRVNIQTLEASKISDITSGGYVEAMARIDLGK